MAVQGEITISFDPEEFIEFLKSKSSGMIPDGAEILIGPLKQVDDWYEIDVAIDVGGDHPMNWHGLDKEKYGLKE